MKSRYPASVFKLISRAFAAFLALTLPSHVQAAGDEGAWQTTSTSGVVRYASHGTTVYGHQFGFVKRARQCQTDILWLNWSSTNPQIEQLVGSEVRFLINVDGTAFEIGVDLRSTFRPVPNSIWNYPLFTNFVAGPKFIDLLSSGQKVTIEIVGPPEVRDLIDITSDEFSLTGFAKARQEAKELCENVQRASDDDTSMFATVRLPFEFTIDVPRRWIALNDTINQSIRTSRDAVIDLSGMTTDDEGESVLIAANTLSPTTYAALRVTRVRPVRFSSEDILGLSAGDLAELHEFFADELRQILPLQGLRLLAADEPKIESIDGIPAIVFRYRRSGPKGPVVVQRIQIPRQTDTLRIYLSFRESERTLWMPAIERIKSSIKFGRIADAGREPVSASDQGLPFLAPKVRAPSDCSELPLAGVDWLKCRRAARVAARKSEAAERGISYEAVVAEHAAAQVRERELREAKLKRAKAIDQAAMLAVATIAVVLLTIAFLARRRISATISRTWWRRSKVFRAWAFGSFFWGVGTLIYVWLFEPFGSYMSDDEILRFTFGVMIGPSLFLGALWFGYKRFVDGGRRPELPRSKPPPSTKSKSDTAKPQRRSYLFWRWFGFLVVAAVVLSITLPGRPPISSLNGAATVLGLTSGLLAFGGVAAFIHSAIRGFKAKHTKSVMITWTVVILLLWASSLTVRNFEAQSAETVRGHFVDCIAETWDRDRCLDRL